MSENWERLSDTMRRCPICDNPAIMTSIGDKPKNCECLRCGERSVKMDVTMEQAIKIWNAHCDTVARAIDTARVGDIMTVENGVTTVSVEEIRKLADAVRKVNELDVKTVRFMEDGEILDIPEKIRDEFSFTGLNFIDFIKTEFYKEGFDGQD